MRKLWAGIKSIVFWLPVIWQDRHWDHTFIWRILKRKLQGVEKAMAGGLHADGLAQARQIHVLILVLDRLIENRHFDIVYHDISWKGRTLDDPPGYDVMKRHEWEEYLIKQDIEYLFDTMKKHIRCWWD